MKIRDVRRKLGLTQHKMGKLMGMPQSSISRIETGGCTETRQQRKMLEYILNEKIQKQQNI